MWVAIYPSLHLPFVPRQISPRRPSLNLGMAQSLGDNGDGGSALDNLISPRSRTSKKRTTDKSPSFVKLNLATVREKEKEKKKTKSGAKTSRGRKTTSDADATPSLAPSLAPSPSAPSPSPSAPSPSSASSTSSLSSESSSFSFFPHFWFPNVRFCLRFQ